MDEELRLSFVLAGHVDHGKSTLIGRLLYDTGSLPPDRIEEMRRVSKELGREDEFSFLLDHLEEEREQGITIDTTQIFFKTERRMYVIIDAPGHREFVRNMVTGAAQAEAAILIVDVNEGLQEQSRRHAYILSLLGISQVVVVVNKMDMAGFSRERFETVARETEAFLAGIGIVPGACIPISALRGDNIAARSAAMAWYEGPHVLESLDGLRNRPRPEDMPLIFPVQDVYRMGEERVIVGRIETGTLTAGREIEVLPSHERASVRTIEVFPGRVGKASAEESVGVTLDARLFVERGMVISDPARPARPADRFVGTILWMSRSPLARGAKVPLRCTTQSVTATVRSIIRKIDSSSLAVLAEDADRLDNLEVGEVELTTDRPVVVHLFREVPELGRFVLLHNENICAGGVIIEV